MPEFLQVSDLLRLHADQIHRYSGEPGVRDLGLLESAIAQPQASFSGQFFHDDIFEMAAAYLFHIANNHPFVDGNKRAGAVAALVFLDLNGWGVEAAPGEIYELTLALATGQAGKAEAAEFFRQRAQGDRQA